RNSSGVSAGSPASASLAPRLPFTGTQRRSMHNSAARVRPGGSATRHLTLRIIAPFAAAGAVNGALT
ncbi:MAG TPA: hypothetical protein VFM52_03190, partial [Rhodanobacter sp.]|nr:hypothetical protein [Rhodanobacter sp.]